MNLRRYLLVLIVALGVSGIWAMQRKRISAGVSPRPLLCLVADTQRELERLPLLLSRVSVQEENRIGEELARMYGLPDSNAPDSDDARIRGYVYEVGSRLTPARQRTGIYYQFRYDPNPHSVNAFALPGGQIVIGRGLLELMESEDELAAVLGHEIAHVDRHHSIERLQYELQSRKLGLGGLSRLASIGVLIFQAGYSKEQELEADREGLRFAVLAGYSPGGAIDLMQLFERLGEASQDPARSLEGEIARMPVQALQEYFRSHPPGRERISEFQKTIAAQGWNSDHPRRPLTIKELFRPPQNR